MRTSIRRVARSSFFLVALLAVTAAPIGAAPDRDELLKRRFLGQLRVQKVEAASRHIEIGIWCRDAGLVAQATAEFLRAVEVGEGQNPRAVKILAIMRQYDEKFWKTVNPKPSKAYIDTYEKKVRAAEEAREEALFKLAKDGKKQGLEDEPYRVWADLLRDSAAPIKFDDKQRIVLAAGEIPEDVSAKIKAAAITVNEKLYLRDGFLDLIPQVKEIREWDGTRVRVRAQPGPAVPEDLLATLEALVPFLQEDLGGRPSKKMTVFVFADRATYGAWLGGAKLSHFTAATGLADGATNTAIVCAEGLPAEAVRGMAMHEMSHLFQYGVTPVVMPSWYSEGFAETYGGAGTFKWAEGKLDAGLPMDRSRVASLSTPEAFIPLSDLVAGDALKVLSTDRKKGVLFYAQSWALLRYLRTAAAPDLQTKFRLWETACRGAALGAQAGKPRELDTAPAIAAFSRLFAQDLPKIETGFKEWLAKPPEAGR